MVSMPTPRFDANTGFNSQWTDPNSSILPTPDWNQQGNQPIWPEETPAPDFSFDSPPQEEFMVENATEPQEASPAQAAFMASVDTDPADNNTAYNDEEESEVVALLAPAEPEALPVLSEFRSTPARNGSAALRLALYTVGGLALLSALAFLVGAVALFGSRPRS
jgi:hypothetical protein